MTIVSYLDDGFGISNKYLSCTEQATQVKPDIISSGLLPNKDNSIWIPTQSVEWLGFLWNLRECTLHIPEIKLNDLHELISTVLKYVCKVRANTLASVCGKIIDMSPVLANATHIMSTCMFSALNEKYDWNIF